MIDLNRPEAVAGAGGELVTEAEALVARLGARPIATLEELEDAVRDRQQIGASIKSVEAFFDPLKRQAHELHKTICAREAAILGPLRRLDDEKRRAIADFKAADERARRERERRLAEEQRLDREIRALDEALQLERAGERAMAAAVVDEAIAAPAPVVVLRDATKGIAGLKMRKTWRWRYVGGDKARALALIPREYLEPDEKKLTAYASSMKESAAIPGIEFYAEDLPVR